jgi:CspA family cold shock protein
MFPVIEGDGFKELSEGDTVDYDYLEAHRDSFRYQATHVRKS